MGREQAPKEKFRAHGEGPGSVNQPTEAAMVESPLRPRPVYTRHQEISSASSSNISINARGFGPEKQTAPLGRRQGSLSSPFPNNPRDIRRPTGSHASTSSGMMEAAKQEPPRMLVDVKTNKVWGVGTLLF